MTKTYRLRQILIIAFCLWHMAATGLYLLPVKGSKIVAKAQSLTKPYILLFSQWQKWDIFSPDPMRRVSVYRIELRRGADWIPVTYLDPQRISWWRSASEMKVLGRLEEGWSELSPWYLRTYCPDVEGTPYANLRLVARSYVLPSNQYELSHMSDTRLHHTESIMATIFCSQAS